MGAKFKADLKETQTQFIQNYEDTILKVVGIQSLFKPEEIFGLVIMGSLSTLSKTKETCEVSVKSLF